MYDTIILGGGPAGLTSGIYAVRRGLSTLVLEKGLPGGQMLYAQEIENYPGFEKTSGHELSERMLSQAKKLGVEVKIEQAESMDLRGKIKTVRTRENEYNAHSVIIAPGGEYQKLGIEGEKEYSGRGVSYCATCDAPFFKDRTVAVIGGGNKAVSDALYLADIAKTTYLIHRRDVLRAEKASHKKLEEKTVKILYNTVVKGFSGKVMLESIKVSDSKTGKISELKVDGVFVSIGTIPNTEIAKAAGIEVDKKGFIKVDKEQKTNISGVYAAGDVTGGVMQISTAIGEGCTAALSAYKHVKDPYWTD